MKTTTNQTDANYLRSKKKELIWKRSEWDRLRKFYPAYSPWAIAAIDAELSRIDGIIGPDSTQ